MPVYKYRTYAISKERMTSYKKNAPVNEEGILDDLNLNTNLNTMPVLDLQDSTKQGLKNKSKNRSKINGSLLDSIDIMTAPIVSRVWKVPTTLSSGNQNKVRFTEVNYGYLKDTN